MKLPAQLREKIRAFVEEATKTLEPVIDYVVNSGRDGLPKAFRNSSYDFNQVFGKTKSDEDKWSRDELLYALSKNIEERISRYAGFSEDIPELEKVADRSIAVVVGRVLALVNIVKDAVKEHKPEAPKNADLGQWAFAEDRNDVPNEENTDEENALFADLTQHVIDNTKLDNDTAKQIKGFIAKNEYTNIFEFPQENYPVAFRGMAVSLENFEELTGIETSELGVGTTGAIDAVFTAKPRGHVASWTVSFEQARKFANESRTEDLPISVILVADTSTNNGKFILNPKKIYDLQTINDYAEEEEVIGVGPIKSQKIIYTAYGYIPAGTQQSV